MIELLKPEVPNFTKFCLSRGAHIVDLLIPTEDPLWPGLCNPSILYDNNELKLILRNVNYVMHASYNGDRNWSSWGPLLYTIPDEDGRHLKTRNYLCSVHPIDGITSHELIDTSKNDWEPQWEFVGHEDARLVRWNDTLYMTGVRRDDNTTGVGRMSLCAIEGNVEVSRVKIDDESFNYCEKNWMPILDMPYHYVRSTNPTVVVKVDPLTGKCETVVEKKEANLVDHDLQLRGSSQVLPWKDGKHIALIHTCTLYFNELQKKYARYHFHFIVWDRNWNVEAISPLFNFNDFLIEFSNGMAIVDGKFHIPFALQDNMSFLMTVDESVIEDFIYRKPAEFKDVEHNTINNFFLKDKDLEALNELAHLYLSAHFDAGAYCLFQRAADFCDNIYDRYVATFYMTRALANIGHRDRSEYDLWWKCIDINSMYPEAWAALSMYAFYRGDYNAAYSYALMAYNHRNNATFYYSSASYITNLILTGIYTEHVDKSIKLLEQYKSEFPDFYNDIQKILQSRKIERIL